MSTCKSLAHLYVISVGMERNGQEETTCVSNGKPLKKEGAKTYEEFLQVHVCIIFIYNQNMS